MKSKGFTLIELLGVILLLAIIALITAPIVLNVISDSDDSTILRSADFYLDELEQEITMNKMLERGFNVEMCVVKQQKLYCDGNLLDIQVKGQLPNDDSIIIFNKGKIKQVKLLYDDKIITNTRGNVLNYSNEEDSLQAGLYDSDYNLLASWDELVNNYELDIETNYTNRTYTVSGSMYAVLNNNEELSSATTIIIDKSVTNIGDYAFAECNNFKSIIIPEGVERIGLWSFYKCKGLKSMLIPSTVKSIMAVAFGSCSNLENLIIPEGVESIGSNSFSHCTSLTRVRIPSTVTSIGGSSSFFGTKNLKELIIDPKNKVYDSRNNSNAIIETATNTLIMGTTTIPDGVVQLGASAFNSRDISQINIPESVTTIGYAVFAGCDNLETVYIPEGVTKIGESSFNCAKLKTIYYKGSATGSPWGAKNAKIIKDF